MRQLRDDTHLILDGEVRVYRRELSLQALRSVSNSQQADQNTFARVRARVAQVANSIND